MEGNQRLIWVDEGHSVYVQEWLETKEDSGSDSVYLVMKIVFMMWPEQQVLYEFINL